MTEFFQDSPKLEYTDQTVIEDFVEQDPETGSFSRVVIQADGNVLVKSLEEER